MEHLSAESIMKDVMVRMISFLGTAVAGEDIEARENYWQLIGKRGKIIETNDDFDGRVLVLFEQSIDDYGLENHNPIKNSLWIRITDLILD
ncbi:hypothetical protein KBK19_10510 [Microvirga sp. STR05]|uniref:Uncharacterized protein n=1 Tax=Hymenobacter duratus TaxID=2771356 RepID=A0ABR8JHA3_9BACT|nr:hypothetical protein [Hymenobacter duratus]MBD2715467.1 hypothetical protein [Hymenobacter duratus]MBR7950375.1 hypothetical protein [Microvirga sp. STR05]